MKTRPDLHNGDIVKLSKKGKSHPTDFPKNSSMIVCKIQGNGYSRNSIITCRLRLKETYKTIKFYRQDLWYTGQNAFKIRKQKG
jgi:hypothetical protein